jgi:mono/diheme cytochrome c family protein
MIETRYRPIRKTGNRRRAAALAAIAAGVALTARPAIAADIDTDAGRPAGERVALNVCATCHVVARRQPDPPLLRPPAPSFVSIANRRGTTREGLLAFLQSTHRTVKAPSTMPNPLLTDDQNAAVVDYLMSLKRR